MSEKFKTFIERAFAVLTVLMGGHLGDRNTYVGASDVSGCPRKAALLRLQPERKQASVASLMVMALGHCIEDLVARLFEAGGCKNIKREVELAHPEHPWLKCHVDFWVETAADIRIRELKSTKGLPEEPYSSWINQLALQMGLAAINNPTKIISGSIMVVDRVCGAIKEFNGYVFDKPLFDALVDKAKGIMAAIKGEGPVPNPEPGLLCGYCPYKTDCPAHKVPVGLPVVPDEVAVMMSEYLIIQAQQKKLKADADLLKANLLSYAGKSCKAISAEGLLLVVSEQKGKTTVDTKRLQKEFPAAYNACHKTGDPFQKLAIGLPGNDGGDV